MRDKIQEKAIKISKNPIFRQTIKSIKPNRTIGGFLGIFLFFILPELIGFYRGKEIASWAHNQTLEEPTQIGRTTYWLLEKFFEDGGSYLNIAIGLLLLYIAWIEWPKEEKDKIEGF
jgi:hypothetical protein